MTSTALISRLDRLEDVVGTSTEEQRGEEDGGEVVALHETADDAPVIKLVNQIVAQAVERGASDIHLAPDGKETAGPLPRSTASCRTSRRCRGGWPPASSRG